MTIEDIKQTVLDFKTAQNAIAAGFDGVELHAATDICCNSFLMAIPIMRMNTEFN
jgi:2,4-dienoyl-CoA reductase-like NADH-dependent reductase (Old Yellow Enzyme family)